MEEEKNYCNEKTKVEWEMGIDEAGRGPVFGPMVYGACIWPIELKETLKKIGFADSKKLTPV
jgi:ribonuclease HII